MPFPSQYFSDSAMIYSSESDSEYMLGADVTQLAEDAIRLYDFLLYLEKSPGQRDSAPRKTKDPIRRLAIKSKASSLSTAHDTPLILSFPLPPSTPEKAFFPCEWSSISPETISPIQSNDDESPRSSNDSEFLAITPQLSTNKIISVPTTPTKSESGTHARELFDYLLNRATTPYSESESSSSMASAIYSDTLEVRFRQRFEEWDEKETQKEIANDRALCEYVTQTTNSECSCSQSGLSTFSASSNPLPNYSTDASVNADTEADNFSVSQIPSSGAVALAASLEILSETGASVPFGSIFEERKTVVCFIRHFLCPNCMDYAFEISRNIMPSTLKAANVQLIIISNGDWQMIKSYKRVFKMPYDVYTDPSLAVYNALGMTLQTMDGGPEELRGKYVRHGLVGGIGMVVKNAVKSGMPLWRNGGTIPQLGGEFVLGPGPQCTFAHRMHNTRSHEPILRILERAGIHLYARLNWVAASAQQLDSAHPKDSFAAVKHSSEKVSSQSTEDFRTLLAQAQLAAKNATRPIQPRPSQDSKSRFTESGLSIEFNDSPSEIANMDDFVAAVNPHFKFPSSSSSLMRQSATQVGRLRERRIHYKLRNPALATIQEHDT